MNSDLNIFPRTHLFHYATGSRSVWRVDDFPLQQWLDSVPEEAQARSVLHRVDKRLAECI